MHGHIVTGLQENKMNMVATPDLPEGIINQPCNIEYQGKQNKDYVASFFPLGIVKYFS